MKYDNEKITHHSCGKIEYLTFKVLDKYSDKIAHGIFLNRGGVSSDIYSSLNFRLLGNDTKENVLENIKRASNSLNINGIYKGHQTHSDNILVLTDENKDKYEVSKLNDEPIDSYIHKECNIASLITTADCNPVIIYDPVNNIIANIHSGWAGTVKKISAKTAIKMHDEFGSKYEDLIVCVGPSIQKCCFTTEDEEFTKQFLPLGLTMEIKEGSKIYHIDLPKNIEQDMIKLGVKSENIILSDICTCCNHDDFYSYRKFKKEEIKDYATFGTIVKKLK